MKLIFILGLFAIIPNLVVAQNWEPVGNGMSFDVRDLYFDNSTDLLHAVGSFRYADTIDAKGYAIWDGDQWLPSTGIENWCNSGACEIINRIVKFEEHFYLSSNSPNNNDRNLRRWDGDNWESIGSPNGASILSLTNETMFCTGLFDTISGVFANRLAIWNNEIEIWESFGEPLNFTSNSSKIFQVEYYEDEFYMAGNFILEDNMNRINRWNGENWQSLEQGVFGFVNSVAAYNELLYVGGYFFESAGNIGDHLMAWNGDQWVNPFPDIEFLQGVRRLRVIEDELYIMGNFTFANQNNFYSIGRFDGNNFCALGGSSPLNQSIHSSIGDLAIGHNRLYAASNHIHGELLPYLASIPLDNVIDTCIVLPTSSTSINSSNKNRKVINIHPNPTSSHFILTDAMLQPGTHITAYNLTGQQVYARQLNQAHEQLTLDARQFGPAGLYLLHIQMPGQAAVVKKVVVKE